MTHFLARLVDRARGTVSRVEPIIPSRYASAASPEMPLEFESFETPRDPAHSPQEESPEPPAQPQPRPSRETHPTKAYEAGDSDSESESQLVDERFRPARPTELSDLPVDSRDPIPGEQHANPLKPQRVTLASLPRPRQPKNGGPNLSNEPAQEAPVVRVTIGRIEVRAAAAPAPPPRPSARRAEPTLSLDAYLKSRKEGAR